MELKYIPKIVLFLKLKKAHRLFPVFTASMGVWLGMLTTPTVGAFCIALSIYFTLVICLPWKKIPQGKIPWEKFRIPREHFISAAVTVLIALFFWNTLVDICDTNNPYKQPLRTGEGNIEVIAEPNGVMGGALHSFGGWGRILLVKDGNNIILDMGGVAARKQIENGQVVFLATPELDANDKSVNKPIRYLTEAEYAVVQFERLPPNSRIISGKAILTFNSIVRIEIPIPPQTMKEDVIVIEDVQRYLKKEN